MKLTIFQSFLAEPHEGSFFLPIPELEKSGIDLEHQNAGQLASVQDTVPTSLSNTSQIVKSRSQMKIYLESWHTHWQSSFTISQPSEKPVPTLSDISRYHQKSNFLLAFPGEWKTLYRGLRKKKSANDHIHRS